MQSIDLTLSLPESMQLPVPNAVSATVVREELLSWHVEDSAGQLWFLARVVGNREPIQAAVAQLDVVHSFEFTAIDHETFYVYAEMAVRAVDNALWPAIERPGTVIVPPIVYTDTGTVQLTVLGEDTALGGVVEHVPNEITVSVERVSEHNHTNGSLAGRLTHRQLEAITVARARGYYEVPRTGTLNEVADALDCSESTASTLLRNAERALVNAALGQ